MTPDNSRRLSCMCDDCQLYAEHLGRAGEILDVHGGTDLSYATQSRMEILSGREHLRAVRLSRKGILRVYTECCKTPVAHIPSAKMAFVAIPHLFMRQGPGGVTRDVMLGPLVHRLQGRHARGEMPEGAHLGTPAALWVRAMARILWDSIRGRQKPSAFHTTDRNTPDISLTVLTETELARLRRCASFAESSERLGLPEGCS